MSTGGLPEVLTISQLINLESQFGNRIILANGHVIDPDLIKTTERC